MERGLAERQEGLKAFMRKYPQGVTILTAKIGGAYHGMTVSSFTSVSMNPPLVMAAIDKGSRMYGLLKGLDHFAVHILSSDQAPLSEKFGTRSTEGLDRFEGLEIEEGPGGAPIIKQCPAHLLCKLYRVYDAGDHVLVLGEVVDSVIRGDFKPLVYRERRYTTVEAERVKG